MAERNIYRNGSQIVRDAGQHYPIYPGVDFLEMLGNRVMALHLHDNIGNE
ncbi:MAG: hypothetical protein FWD82_02875 [Defluviitaleaceae bacterium]|nr:hypothetical protein [Defluviitaleaceae bacterium]